MPLPKLMGGIASKRESFAQALSVKQGEDPLKNSLSVRSVSPLSSFSDDGLDE